MILETDFVTDYVTTVANDYGVTVPTDFDALDLITRVYEGFSHSQGWAYSDASDFEYLHDLSLSLEVETTRLLGI